jgi:hypothetical protein
MITNTQSFRKKISNYYKYSRKPDEINNTNFNEAVKQIINIANDNKQIHPLAATEYFEENGFHGIETNIFYKFRISEYEDLHIIYVICENCSKSLKCKEACNSDIGIIVCFYDIWIAQ